MSPSNAGEHDVASPTVPKGMKWRLLFAIW